MSSSTRRTRVHALTALALLLAAAPILRADEPGPPPRPKYNPNARFMEDWSNFQPPAEGGDWFDPIKHISLSGDDWLWVSFGGQARLRFETWEDFGTLENDDADSSFLLNRFRAHTDIHAGEHLRFFFEGLSANSTDRTFRLDGVLDVNTAQLQQAFGELKLPFTEDLSAGVRVGRQELTFGKQRVVSPLDWTNTRRTWEGVRATANIGKWSIDGFWTQFVPVQKYHFDTPDTQHEFYGLYATGPTPIPGANLDAYWLARDRKDLLMPDGDLRHTFGARLFGKVSDTGFDYDVEGDYQTGDRAGLDVDAFSFSSELGYTAKDMPGKPRVFGGFDYASGDDDPTDDQFGTFDQLYPLGHAYFGFIDLVGRQNMMAYTGGVSFNPLDKLTVLVQGHVFQLAEEESPLFNAGGGPVGGRAGEDEVGTEIDILLKYQHDIHTAILAGYSHFMPGDYFALPGRDDIDFFYLSWEFTF